MKKFCEIWDCPKFADEAIKLFELCLKLYPKSSQACEGVGKAYEIKGNKDKAIEFYQKALDLNPSSEHIRKKLEELKKSSY